MKHPSETTYCQTCTDRLQQTNLWIYLDQCQGKFMQFINSLFPQDVKK